MDSKYYVPEISEFHVGFEYEVNCFIGTDTDIYYGDMNNAQNNQWCQFVFPDKFTGYDLDKLLKNNIRVKFLDKDDIENLGFKKSLRNQCIGWDDYYFEKTINPEYDYFLYLTLHVPSQRFNSNFIRDNQFKLIVHRYYISDSYETTHIESNINSGDSEIIYKGLIRNISELKKILIQTGVL